MEALDTNTTYICNDSVHTIVFCYRIILLENHFHVTILSVSAKISHELTIIPASSFHPATQQAQCTEGRFKFMYLYVISDSTTVVAVEISVLAIIGNEIISKEWRALRVAAAADVVQF